MSKIIKDQVSAYYTSKLKTFGETPQGVDWNSTESQTLRFRQLCQVIAEDDFSVVDFGCGYGAMLEFLKHEYETFSYAGFDISQDMIASANEKFKDERDVFWCHKEEEIPASDYVIASGIFNVKMEFDEAMWKKYILDTLHTINTIAKKGFSFNILTSYSDAEYMKNNLYYADPTFFFDFCKKNFSRQVALLHDYPLYEFTIIVRKNYDQ